MNVKISTNSLASTDNLAVFSGYYKIRKRLLEAGIEVYEYKPNPENLALLYERFQRDNSITPTFAIHAKSLVVDGKTALIGTFNLDPRSINLNTEVAMIVPNEALAQELRLLILNDAHSNNSWKVGVDNPQDKTVSLMKRIKLVLLCRLPLDAIL